MSCKPGRCHKINGGDLKAQVIDHAPNKTGHLPVEPEGLYGLFVHQAEVGAAGGNTDFGHGIDEFVVHLRGKPLKKAGVFGGEAYGLDNFPAFFP